MICWDNIAYFIWIAFLWIVVTIIFPYVCLKPQLKKIPIAERILFCQIIAVLYCSALSYILGLFRIYYTWTILIGYFAIPFGIRIWIDRKKILEFREHIEQPFSDLLEGKYGLRLMIRHTRIRISNSIKCFLKKYTKTHKMEWFCFFLVLLFLVVYFGTYKFTHYAYAAPDEEVHLYWIQSLRNNNIFPAGMYPHSMHNILALLCVLTPVAEIHVVLNYSPMIVLMNLFAVFVLMKKVQKRSFTAVLACVFFYMNGLFAAVAYSRFQFTIPMEFGMIGIPALVIAWLNLLNEKKRIHFVLFLLSICYTMSAHFYAAIIAAVICIGFGLAYLKVLWKEKLIHKLIGSAFAGILLACIPFGIGFVMDYPFEQSMNWALSIMQEDSKQDKAEESAEEIVVEYWLNEDGTVDKIDPIVIVDQEPELTLQEKIYAGVSKVITGITQGLQSCVNKPNAVIIILSITMLALLFGLIGRLGKKENVLYFRFHTGAAISMLLLLAFVCFPFLDLPEIMDANRIKVFLLVWFTITVFSVMECIVAIFAKILHQYVGIVACLAGSCALLILTDNVTRNRYFYCVNQESAMSACMKIMDKYGKNNFTIVSTTNELSVVRYIGFHVEWIDFLSEQYHSNEGDVYTIPTEDVFFIIEKKILNYGVADYEIDGWGNEFIGEISEEYAIMNIDKKFLDSNESQRSRVYQQQRPVVMSKAYTWAQTYQSYYPDEFQVAYEDDNVIVFWLHQNPYALNNLLLSDEEVFNETVEEPSGE